MVSLLQRVTFEKRESNQSALAPPFGASLRLGMPSLRHCSGGPPPSAIHGRGRLPRHPCRGAPCATPAFGLWERGSRSRSRSKAEATATARSTASRASPLPQLDGVHPEKIVRLTGRHRRQASSHRDDVHLQEIWRAAIAAMRRPDKPAFTKYQGPAALPFTTQQAER
jgi:hypothetical protein